MPDFATVVDVTTTVGSETDKDLAEHWLDTGGIPVVRQDGTKSYPKRSELRRAEARGRSRPSSSRPSASRPAGSLRPPAPVTAPRSPEATRRPAFQARFGVVPSPAVLPIPRTSPARPAGIDVPLPQRGSADAFHRAQPPVDLLKVPTDWDGDLLEDLQAPEESSPRRSRCRSTVSRLLVMALVVSAEGVAVSQFADPIDVDASAVTASLFTLGSAPDEDIASVEDHSEADDLARQQAEAQAAAATLKTIQEASSAKADAAQSMSRKASVALDKQKKAEAEAAKKKKEAEKRAAALARAKAAAEAEANASAREKALTLGNSRENPRAAAKYLLADHGWSSAEFTCLDSLWMRESSWNYQAENPSSGAYGIPQSLPADKMASAGSDWRTNPVTQMEWGLDYIADRYGTPCAAWDHSESVGWY